MARQPAIFGEDEPVKDSCAAFETFFWRSYPKKVGKLAALREWNKLKPTRALCEQIQQALAWQVTQHDWTKDDGQWIPDPRKWLHHGKWLDERSIGQRRMNSGTSTRNWKDTCQHDPPCHSLAHHRGKVLMEQEKSR